MCFRKIKTVFSLAIVMLIVLNTLVPSEWALAAEPGQLTLTQSKLGNIFMEDEPVEIPVIGNGDAIYWTVKDFWGNTVSSGNLPSEQGVTAVINPEPVKIGYFEMELESRNEEAVTATAKTTFAKIRYTETDADRSRVGVMTHFAQNWNTDIMPLIAKAGIKNIRDEHYWGNVEKVKGEYEFSAISDAYMQAAQENGIQVLPIMSFSNGLYDSQPNVHAWTVRRWVSDTSGTVNISGYFQLTQAQGSGSDGTGFRIFVDGREIFKKIQKDQTSVTISLKNVAVNEGSIVDIVTTPGDQDAANSWYDGVKMVVEIWKMPSGSGSFHSDKDFSGVQGTKNWYYGYALIPADRWDHYDPSTDFKEMTYAEDQGVWKNPSYTWSTQKQSAMTPDIKSNSGGVSPYTDSGRLGYANYGKAMLDYFTSMNAPIPAIEVWNEYNGSFSNGPAASDKPYYYTEMLKKTYEVLKDAYPDVPVIGAAAVMIPTGYLEDIFELGALDYMDAVVIHPYVQNWDVRWPELVWYEINDLNNQIKRHNNNQPKPIWVTEYGMSSTDRKYTAKFNARQLALMSSFDNVECSYTYLLRDDGSFPYMGLLKAENAPEGKYAPNPSFVATANLVHHLNDATPLGRESVSNFSNLYIMNFTDSDGEQMRIAWSADQNGETAEFTTSESLTVVDIMGVETVMQPVGGKVSIPLGDSLIIIKGNVDSITGTAVQPIADSFISFSGVSGHDNWQYGYYQDNEFKAMHYTPEFMWNWQWQGEDDQTLKVTQPGGYPSRITADRPAVRRWTSTVESDLKVQGMIGPSELNYSIRVDGETVFDQTLDSVRYMNYEITIPVEEGSTVDFVLQHPSGQINLKSDKTIFTARIYDKAVPEAPVAPVLELGISDNNHIFISNYEEDYFIDPAIYGELQYQLICDGSTGEWMNYHRETGIPAEPVTEYGVQVRYAGNTNYHPSHASTEGIIITGKGNQDAPPQPEIIRQAETQGGISLAVAPVENGEYAVVAQGVSLTPGDWKVSNEFSDLAPGQHYDIYTRYKETVSRHASPESQKLTIVTDKLTQAPPVIEYEREGDWETEGVTVRIISPSTGAIYSTDDFSTTVSNPIRFPVGVASASISVKLDETATHKQSATANVELDFSKQNQTAPDLVLSADSDENKVLLIFDIRGGQTGVYEYKIDDEANYTDVPVDGRIEITAPGKLINLFVRDKGNSNYNPSPDATAAITLPKYKNHLTVTVSEANFSITDTTIAMIAIPATTSGSAIEYSFDGGPYIPVDLDSLPVFSDLEPESDHTFSVRAAGDAIRGPGVAMSITLNTTRSLSGGSDIISVKSPGNVQISGTNISADVSNGTTSLLLDFDVSENAVWRLYSDSECEVEISGNAMVLTVGTNTAYIKVTAENGISKIYTIRIERASAVSSSQSGSLVVSDVTGTTISPQTTTSNGTTNARLSDQSIRKALDNAGNDGRESGERTEILVDIPVKMETDRVSAQFFKTSLEVVAKSENTLLKLKLGDVVLTFSDTAISTISKAAEQDVVITAGRADMTQLTDKQENTINGRPVYHLSVTSNGISLGNFVGSVQVSVPYTLKAGENPDSVVIYYLDEEGNREIVENGVYDTATGKVTFLTDHFSLYMIGYSPVIFNDVINHWGKFAIEFSAARGMVSGVGNGKYQPDRAITRAEFVQMIQKVLKLSETAEIDEYSDVEAGKWYYRAIMALKSAGLLEGIDASGNQFKPDQMITRQEMAVILANTAIYKNIKFSSDPLELSERYKDFETIRNDYRDEIQIVVKLGLMNGVGNNAFAPESVTTRAQAAQVQLNLLKLLNEF